jgi:thiol:disulfide interchange protein DsbD
MTFPIPRPAAWTRLVGIALAALALHAPARAADDYLDPEQAFRGSARAADGRTVEVRFAVAPKYHLYRERLAVEADAPAKLGAVDLPAGTLEHDANFDRQVEVLRDTVVLRVPVAAAPSDFALRVTYQGCADEGLCYPPQTATVAVTGAGGLVTAARWVGDAGAAPALAEAATAPGGSELSRVQSVLQSKRPLAIAGVFLLAGLLLAFTPCVLPMIPILSSIIVGRGGPVSRGRGLALSAAYSLGMALVYTAMGMAAGLAGEGLAAALQNPWVLGGFAALLAGMALSMFDVFSLQMPSTVQAKVGAWSNRLPGGRFASVFLMGGLSALIVGPCVAAPLAGALVFISQTRDTLLGGLALFSLAAGMSVPLLLVGLSAGTLLPRAGAWMQHVKTFFGVLLLAVALWMVSPLLPGAVLMGVIGAALLVAAAACGLFERREAGAGMRHRLAQGVGLVLAVLGTTQMAGALAGADNPLQPLRPLAVGERAAVPSAASTPGFQRVRSAAELDRLLQAADRPVMLDFYADWCTSCKEMEHLTFSDPAVAARMARALRLQVDVTANTDADRALLKRFGLYGPPAIVFFDPQGRERADARVVGYVPPRAFEGALASAGL